MTREFMCPACGKKLFSYEQGTRKYGYVTPSGVQDPQYILGGTWE